MKVYKLEFKQIINKDLDTVFDFFSKPENLSSITPKKLDFKILTPKPILMKEGQLIDYTLRIFGKKIRWKTIISEFIPPKMFIDQQLMGPYSMWHHKHIFNEIDGGVEIIDRINYALPFGFIGQIVNYFFIKNDLKNIFKYRYEIINDHFKEHK